MIDFGKIAVLGKLYKLLQKMLSKYIEKPKMCAKDRLMEICQKDPIFFMLWI